MKTISTTLKGKKLFVARIELPEDILSSIKLTHTDNFSFCEVNTKENHFIILQKHGLLTITYIIFTEQSIAQSDLIKQINSTKFTLKEEWNTFHKDMIDIRLSEERWRDEQDKGLVIKIFLFIVKIFKKINNKNQQKTPLILLLMEFFLI